MDHKIKIFLLFFSCFFLLSNKCSKNSNTRVNCLNETDIIQESASQSMPDQLSVSDHSKGQVFVWNPNNSATWLTLTQETCQISIKKEKGHYVVYSNILPSYIQQPVVLKFRYGGSGFYVGHNIGEETNDVFILQQQSGGIAFTHTMVSDRATIESLEEAYNQGTSFPAEGYNKKSTDKKSSVIQYGQCSTKGFIHKECQILPDYL